MNPFVVIPKLVWLKGPIVYVALAGISIASALAGAAAKTVYDSSK